jgi:hypothetical protein
LAILRLESLICLKFLLSFSFPRDRHSVTCDLAIRQY